MEFEHMEYEHMEYEHMKYVHMKYASIIFSHAPGRPAAAPTQRAATPRRFPLAAASTSALELAAATSPRSM